MVILGGLVDGAQRGLCLAQQVGDLTFGTGKIILADMDATSDLLKLFKSVSDLAEQVFRYTALQPFARAFSNITEFASAKSFVGRTYDLVSGEAAHDRTFVHSESEVYPDYPRVASKICYLVSDLCSTTRWLSSIGAIDGTVRELMLQVGGAVPFNLLQGIGDIASLSGSILNFVDSVRVLKEDWTAFPEGGRARGEWLLKQTRNLLDVAHDVLKIALVIICNTPGLGAAVRPTVAIACFGVAVTKALVKKLPDECRRVADLSRRRQERISALALAARRNGPEGSSGGPGDTGPTGGTTPGGTETTPGGTGTTSDVTPGGSTIIGESTPGGSAPQGESAPIVEEPAAGTELPPPPYSSVVAENTNDDGRVNDKEPAHESSAGEQEDASTTQAGGAAGEPAASGEAHTEGSSGLQEAQSEEAVGDDAGDEEDAQAPAEQSVQPGVELPPPLLSVEELASGTIGAAVQQQAADQQQAAEQPVRNGGSVDETI